jgi:hypothetical protein
MTTLLEKEVKREIAVDGVAYNVLIDPEGLRVVPKGKRTPIVTLKWKDLVTGDTALAVALQASVAKR